MSRIDDEAATWMVLRTERELTESERLEFESWYEADVRHKGAYLRAVAINNALNRATVQKSLRPQLTQTASEARPWQSRRTFARYGGIAAGLAILGGVFFAASSDQELELATTKGELRQFPLADQSIANLNSASELEVKLTETSRQVKLKKGEAWFKVAKDKTKPFIVEAGEVRVRAVGTAFAVRRHANGADVLVTEGMVEVWSNKGSLKRVLLSQGEHAFVPDQPADIKVAHQSDEVERKLAWRKGKLIFINQTLGEAVADFNRYSPRKIVIVDPAIQSMTFIGQYPVDAPEIFAKDVSVYLDVPLVITADTILIGSEKTGAASRHKDI